MAAGHLSRSRRSPDLLRSSRTAALLEMVVPAWAGSSTTTRPLQCGGSTAAGCHSAAAAARSPPPAAAGVGLLATNHHSVTEMPLPSPPLAAGVGLHPTYYLSTGQELPSPPPAAAGVGLHATAPHSSMAVPPTPPLPPAAGVGPRATDPHSSVAVLLPLPPPAAPSVGLHPTDHLSSMESQLPAASGVGLLAMGHHLRRSPVLPLLLRSPRTTPLPAMALPWSSFTPSLPPHGPSAVAKPPVPAAVAHILEANGGRRGFERSHPSVRKSSSSITFCISGCGDMQNLIIPNQPSGWHNTGTRYHSRHYCKDTKIPHIPYDKVLPPPPPPPADLISAPDFDLDSAQKQKMFAQEDFFGRSHLKTFQAQDVCTFIISVYLETFTI
uniref:Uncharacterized protein n=1 Tax=Oryza meridionalis TaxID=40149 RepID=A0A0E0DGN6_9ORYZ